MDTSHDQPTTDRFPPEDSRRERRYKRLAAAHLPAWSPPAIRNAFARNLRLVSSSRAGDERRLGENGLAPHLLRELELLQRLCIYHSEIDMRRVWEKIAGLEIKNSKLTWGLQTSEERISLVLSLIIESTRRFEKIPKVTPAERIKKINKTISAISKALDALRSDPWATALSPFIVPSYFGMENIKMRAQNGEVLSQYELTPHLALMPKTSAMERTEGDEPEWDRLPGENRYAWLVSALEETSMEDILEFTARSLAATMSSPAEIQHPGRDDSGLVPYLIREVSALMQMLYKQPLDDTVAILVSAIANLAEPLDRNSVRPYLKAARNNSAGRS